MLDTGQNPTFSSLRRKKPNCEIQIGHFNERGPKVRIEIYFGSAHYTYMLSIPNQRIQQKNRAENMTLTFNLIMSII